MPQPTLRTARLELRPLAEEHLEFEVELDSDPEVMRYLLGRAATRRQVESQHRRRLARGREVDGLGFWVGFTGAEFVGWWILAPGLADDGGEPAPGVAELGYRLQRRWWRRGLATEGARELLRYGFDDLGLDRVVAETMAVNTGSRAVLAGLGLTHVRSFHEHFAEPVAGSEHGEVGYALTRSQWRVGRGADVRLGGVSDAPTPASATFTADVTLADLRGSIDNLDAALIHLLAERFKLTRTVGEFKAEHGLPAADPAREARQIARLRDLAAAASLDPVIAEKYLTFIVSEVVRHHEAIARDRA